MGDLREKVDLVSCPYNPAHRMLAHRLNIHLVKCKKNHPNVKMVRCDFNSTHLVPEPEIQYHHSHCKDRKVIESQLLPTEVQDESKPKYPIPHKHVDMEESWDDLNEPSYNPQKYLESSNVLRHMDVESEAKRKDFRMSERQRLGELNNETNNDNEIINLPRHRTVTNMEDGLSQVMRRRIMQGAGKVYSPAEPTTK